MTETQTASRRGHRLWWLLFALLCLLILAWMQRERLASWPNYQVRRKIAQRDYAGALEWLEFSKRVSKTNPQTEFLLGRVRRRQGMMVEARRHLKRATYLGYPADMIEREQWLAAAQSGQLSAAEDQLPAMLQEPNGEEAEICEAYVIGYLRMRRYESALSLIDAWIQDLPNDPQAYYWAGQIYRDLDSLDEARNYLSQALARDPEHRGAALGMGELLLTAKEIEAAAEYFQVARKGAVERTDASLGLARCLRTLGDTQQAITILDEILSAQPDHVDAVVQRANLDIELGDYAQAEQRLQPLIESNDRDAALRFVYGTALRGLGRVDDAQGHFDYSATVAKNITRANDLARQVAGKPNDPDLRHEIGTLYLEYGTPQEGLIWLHSVLEFDPAHQATHRALADYYAARAAENSSFAALAQRHRMLAGPASAIGP